MVYDAELKLTPEQGRTVTEIRAKGGSNKAAAAAVGLDLRLVMQWATYHCIGSGRNDAKIMTWPLRKEAGVCVACATRPPLEGKCTCCPECEAAVERWRAAGLPVQPEARVLDVDPLPDEVWDGLSVMDGMRKV